MQAKLFIEIRADLTEGPCWDARAERLIWVDILGKSVHISRLDGTIERTFPVDGLVGAAVIRQSGGLVVAKQDGFAFLDQDNGRLQSICDPEADRPQNRFNDGKCDPAGRFWAGTMNQAELPNQGSLYTLEPDLSVKKRLRKVSISNGLTWNPAQDRMYYIDTPTRRIDCFDYDRETGNLSNRRPTLVLPEDCGYPDGMTIDREGMLWVAEWDGWRVARWDPATGRLLTSIELPTARVTSCTFGGSGLDTLFITTARAGLTPAELAAQPLAGSLFTCRTQTQGLPGFTFAG